MKLNKILFLKLLTLVLLPILYFSCNKDTLDGGSSGTNLLVTVRVTDVRFDDYGKINNIASSNIDKFSSYNSVQTSALELSDDLMMLTELRIDDNRSLDVVKKGSSIAPATFRIELKAGALYRILVFKRDGSYVTERDYVYKNEDLTEKLLLDGGAYTFVAYSLNNSESLPDVGYLDGNSSNKKLSNMSISATNVQDILFEKINADLHVDKNNDLNLVFRHKFNYLTTVIDATQTKYKIANVSAYLSPIFPHAQIRFSDELITRSGASSSVRLNFNRISDYIMEAEGVVVNAPSDTNLLTVTGLTVGPFASEIQRPFKNLTLIPGARYTLMVRLIPKDKNIDNYRGYPVTNINGVFWMRYNLGADSTIWDLENSVSQQQHGDFYQWGREYPLAKGISNHLAGLAPDSWDPYVNLVPSAWYKGSEQSPIKGDRDPCPSGFRIPTLNELNLLKSGTEASIVGNWDGDSNNYSAGILFRSIRNKDVYLTLPAQGAYAPSGIDGEGLPGAPAFRFGGLVHRAEWAACWASYLDISNENANKGLVGRLRVTSFNNIPRIEVDYRKPAATENTVGAYPIRCVAE